MSGNRFFSSSDTEANGHGIQCNGCSQLQIHHCMFEGLVANKGSAIQISNQMKADTEIIGCTFRSNRAMKRAGAIDLKEAGNVLIRNNTFLKNSVENEQWRFSDGGAIYFSCFPTKTKGKECNVVLD